MEEENNNVIEELNPSLQNDDASEDETIINDILYQLDGWILDNPENENQLPTKYNKKVTSDEVLHFYNTALNYACNYTDRNNLDDIPTGKTAVTFWSAGLLWNKYNIRSNNQLDETNILGFGDKLIVQAKEMLKPYKSYLFHAY